ncbi:hypothetical protein FHS94_003317 [Sphingomonas aerophila]|uniref:Uncharacterized protein n=1 Tax=Sphingomonas aerophila TaxID=1344948 RepID=A0A7W9EVP1_9SPHN|nr:hypothetical protein [Sphingomonas aerophila]
MWSLLVWNVAALIAVIYCLIKAVFDLRARRFVWGIIGLLSAGIILLTPMKTHAIKVDLPIAQS